MNTKRIPTIDDIWHAVAIAFIDGNYITHMDAANGDVDNDVTAFDAYYFTDDGMEILTIESVMSWDGSEDSHPVLIVKDDYGRIHKMTFFESRPVDPFTQDYEINH